jgi:hypothetical protein
MEQPALPHNVAWPFSAFLPSWCYALFAATLCGRKRVLTLNLASILRKMVLPDGFDHGVGHPLLLLYDAKAPLGKNSNYFNGLGHDLSNPSISLF